MTARRRAHGRSGIKHQATFADSGQTPSSMAHSRQLRAKGPTLNTLLSRAMYFQQKNAQAQQDADQQREQDQAMLEHIDLAPSPVLPSTIATASLEAPPDNPQTGGEILLGGETVPSGFLPKPL